MILDSLTIPKFKCKLPKLKVFAPNVIKDPYTNETISHNYIVTANRFFQQMLPYGYPKTELFGYGGAVYSNDCCCNSVYNHTSVPGPIFLATRDIPINVQWINRLYGPHPLAVDPTICWADPNNIGILNPTEVPPFPPGVPEAQEPIPIVTHLHGGETSSVFDGHPEAWFTPNEKIIGPTFSTSTTQYLNKQPSMNIWYHDHTLGMTRLNVYCGLYGPYIIKDLDNPLDCPGEILPKDQYDIPLIIKDYTFNDDGSIWFPNVGDYPELHPYWQAEFYGNTITVNGAVWPNLNVERRVYRFRILNGSNARFYNLYLTEEMTFTQIGSDGGYLPEPVELSRILIAPAERVDILIDFSKCSGGEMIILQNDADAPYPDGDPENFNPETTGLIMQFTIKDTERVHAKKLPEKLNYIPTLTPDSPNRVLVLTECIMDENSTGLYLNGQKFTAPVSEMPMVGSTEEWEIVNLTGDAHPIHIHLIQFLIKSKQLINVDEYSNAWMFINGMPPLNHSTIPIPLEGYLVGDPINPPPNEKGWKDTAIIMPGEVMRLTIRFAPQYADEKKVMPGVNLFPFNPSIGPGYMWHCHILDHEDNEMMRPYMVMSSGTMDMNGDMKNMG
ncbi:multicopper oxidase [Paraclostridium ghonii]|uniref:FtsP/CotA-like multicopper oxidase with cupredoxin domain n=1 Tax=Paraclostridium ghonii TaxID=29358 RepID=A0ABU0MZQ4_9FIRM|nr:multicopper oxidase [Paeniclostridium ghonii]MDQ0556397.1 FtsP/CotA-like multicopper oxidase with cupredoxin domain [Paeniclostridium ghonii]